MSSPANHLGGGLGGGGGGPLMSFFIGGQMSAGAFVRTPLLLCILDEVHFGSLFFFSTHLQ